MQVLGIDGTGPSTHHQQKRTRVCLSVCREEEGGLEGIDDTGPSAHHQ